ncbi:MAG: helix-turn-helix transcriptional regulator [Desulfoplanes sp.]
MKRKNECHDLIDSIFAEISDQEMHYEELLHAVSEEINTIMLKNGVTKAELANRMGVSRPYVTKLLRGANVSLQTLSKVAFALDSTTCISMIPNDWEYKVFAVSPLKVTAQKDRRARFDDGFREKEGYPYASTGAC